MKVKKITIMGMHKVQNKTYEINDNITYFIGENGVGKSTILEAIQLALLGYIPGYAKTNESIMKHAAGPVMYVEAYLDEGVKITRTWTRSGSSVQSKVDVTGYDGDLKDLIGQVDLPVFDFNEFRSMTSNKLKDWFISFLPSSSGKLNIKKELKEALGERALDAESLISEAELWVKESGLEGLELIRKLNDKFKEDQSFTKGQISKLEGTIQSLVRYDEDENVDESSVRQEIGDLEALKTALIRYESESAIYEKSKAAVEELQKQLPATTLDGDPRIKDLRSQIDELNAKNNVLKADYQDLMSEIQELQRQKAMLPRAGATCPYTNSPCETAAQLAAKSAQESAKIDEQIKFKQEELKDCDTAAQSSNDREILKLTSELSLIQSSYDRLIAMQLQLASATLAERPTDLNMLQIEEKIRRLNDQLIHVAANRRYEELSEKVTADKFKLENELEIYKLWIKLTDANGLQTRLMNKPFEELEGDMSAYLSKMFNKDIKAKFNLEAKANSFSFGLERDNQYIEFDYLSSGERCLFTLALIMCILNRSESAIRTILIDDILDHLDSANANYLFDSLKSVTDIQFILAGVKECSDSSICYPVQ